MDLALGAVTNAVAPVLCLLVAAWWLIICVQERVIMCLELQRTVHRTLHYFEETDELALVQEILEVEQLMGDEDMGLDLTADNVERSLDEIRSVAAEGLHV